MKSMVFALQAYAPSTTPSCSGARMVDAAFTGGECLLGVCRKNND
jgi:hypothetical protein